jgi:hypothetical protein
LAPQTVIVPTAPDVAAPAAAASRDLEQLALGLAVVRQSVDQLTAPTRGRAAMTRIPIIALLAGLAMGSAGAKDYRVSEIQPIGEIKCNFHNEGSFSSSTEPCFVNSRVHCELAKSLLA